MRKRKVTFEEMLMEEGILPKWIEKGREEGREETRIETAKNALAEEGLAVEVIQKITGLDPETIKSFSLS